MQDVKLAINDQGYYDLVIENGSIAGVEGLDTAILVSIYTDARAPASTVSDPLMRRGWVGNILNVNLERELGSILWIADTSRVDQNTLNYFNRETKACLKWMLDDGIVKNIIINSEIVDSKNIKVNISLIKLNQTEADKYSILWKNTGV
jgi:phage gp46-like protein